MVNAPRKELVEVGEAIEKRLE